MKKRPNIIEFVAKLGLSLSLAQTVLLKATYGLPLNTVELSIFTACTGRAEYLGIEFPEIVVVAGARSGKDSRIAAPVCLYGAAFGNHERYLERGERAVIPAVAQDRRGANILRGYIQAQFQQHRWLRELIDGEPTVDEIRLKSGVSIICFPSTMRSMRGWSIPVGVMDELGYFRLEGSPDSDVEIQTSIRRGGINFPRTKLLKISTPYLKSGVLADDFRNYYSSDSRDVLVWKASSILMNPTLSRERLQREQRLDPTRFAREYEAEFSDDLSAFMPSAWIESAIAPGVFRRNPQSGERVVSAVDQSGLRADAFCHAIAATYGTGYMLCYLKKYNPTGKALADLDGIVREIIEVTKAYQCNQVIGDAASEAWVQTAFEKHGMGFSKSERNTSQCFLACEPLFAQGKIDLLDDPGLVRELKLLERHNRPGGGAIVTHPRGAHDDAAAAVCRAIANLDEVQEIDFATIAKLNESFPDRVVRPDLNWEDQPTPFTTHDYGLPSPKIDIRRFGGFR